MLIIVLRSSNDILKSKCRTVVDLWHLGEIQHNIFVFADVT